MKKYLALTSIICMTSLFANINMQGLDETDPDFSNLNLLISPEDINSKIIQTAYKIDEDYFGKEIVIIMIMKGSFVFVSDLIREIKTPFSVETINASSYGKKGSKRGKLKIEGLDKLNLKGKHVLLIDDIFDSGNTLNSVSKKIEEKNPASVKTVIMLLKKTPNRLENATLPNYYLFEIEDDFVIGYGLDYKEYFRGLKGIYFVR